jgi:hypothetical protein
LNVKAIKHSYIVIVRQKKKHYNIFFNFRNYRQNIKGLLEKSGNFGQNSPNLLLTMEQRFFTFSLIIEGTTEKVLQFIMPLKSIYSKNLCFDEEKMYF